MSAAGTGGQAQSGSSGSGSSGAGSSSGGSTAGGAAGQPGGSGASGGGAAGSAGAGGAGGAGAGAGGGGAGGTGGQAAYNPCPTNGDPCRVMPLGDSITDLGGIENSAYRLPLFRLALMNDKNLTFVGSHESGPQMVDGVPFPRSQEGHSGWTIADGMGRDGLYDMIQGWLMATPPDIITLMIGTNDIDINFDRPNAPMRLGLLLDRIAMYAPNALTVVAQMVPTTQDDQNVYVQAFNAEIPAVVKQRADAGKHMITVDMYGAFTKNANYKTELMGDKLHPKQAGLEVMAQVWYDAIGPLLPAKP